MINPDPIADVVGDAPTRKTLPDREVEIELITMLRGHGPREGEALAAYKALVESSPDPAVQYLGRIILDDERRHHRIAEEMLNALEGFVWEVEIDPAVPAMPERADPGLLAQTRRLLALERDDERELKRMRKAMRGSERSSMLPLLVDLMLHDTAKHIDILTFVRDRTTHR